MGFFFVCSMQMLTYAAKSIDDDRHNNTRSCYWRDLVSFVPFRRARNWKYHKRYVYTQTFVSQLSNNTVSHRSAWVYSFCCCPLKRFENSPAPGSFRSNQTPTRDRSACEIFLSQHPKRAFELFLSSCSLLFNVFSNAAEKKRITVVLDIYNIPNWIEI